MKLVIFALVLSVVIAYGQVDKPVSPEDLADQLAAEQTQIKSTLGVLAAVRRHLNSLVKSGTGEDPVTMAPIVHADILACLAAGDYHRKESKLYEQAAVSAGEIAGAWEQKANAAQAATSEEQFTRQMEEIDRRTGELSVKKELTAEDRSELLALGSRRKPLQDALRVLAQVRSSAVDRTRYAAAAKEMRGKEHLFQLRAEDSRLHELEDNIQCESGVLTLRELNERGRVQEELRRWGVMPVADSSQIVSAKRPVAVIGDSDHSITGMMELLQNPHERGGGVSPGNPDPGSGAPRPWRPKPELRP